MNNFQISGFVVNNATVNQFATASVARFGISVRRTEKIGDEEKRFPQSSISRHGRATRPLIPSTS